MEPPSKIARHLFDELPDCIIHTIFSLLDIKDIARICTVSKGLRRVCFSMPDLFLHIEKFEDELHLSSFNYFLHTLLLERNGLELKTLKLKSFCPRFNSSDRFDLRTLLYDVVRLKVQTLLLQIVTDRFRLPAFVINSTRVLKLDLHNGLLVLPNADMGLVQELSLSRFQMVEGGGVSLGDWVSSRCNAIEKLQILQFDGIQHLHITRPSLKTLRIIRPGGRLTSVDLSAANLKNLELDWILDNTNLLPGKSFTVFAPNLCHLRYISNVLPWSVSGGLASLQTAQLVCEFPPHFLGQDQRAVLLNFFSHIQGIRYMSLGAQCTNLLYEHNGAQSMSWKNLKILQVFVHHSVVGFKIAALASLLKASPNLRMLKLRRVCEDSKPLGLKVYDESVGCFDSDEMLYIDQLSHVMMDLFRVDDIEIELVRYLLKHGKALKWVVIFHTLDSSVVEKIRAKLDGFTKASSDVSFKFVWKAL